MVKRNRITVYEMSINARSTWLAHSLSNEGTRSIRLLSRRQLLDDGTETDACSGNLFKRRHSMLLTEYMQQAGIPVCANCAWRDGRRAAAATDLDGLTIETILTRCGVCDAHGFLITAKNESAGDQTAARQRISKGSLVEYSMGLALPNHFGESEHLYTRMAGPTGEGQMLTRKSARSGVYALCIRFKAVGIGADTESWSYVLANQKERIRRYQAVLRALRDQLVSPRGAQTATMLPHTTGFAGVIVIRTSAGGVPMWSPFADNYVELLTAMADAENLVFPFEDVGQFYALMSNWIETSVPCKPIVRRSR
jgi:CRISPR/Cas system-associated protein Cas7 (RAMP superfamily)